MVSLDEPVVVVQYTSVHLPCAKEFLRCRNIYENSCAVGYSVEYFIFDVEFDLLNEKFDTEIQNGFE